MVRAKRGLVVGRFQPYHSGHHDAVKRILKHVDELIIVIGSTQQSYELENPFTAGERLEMISRALKKEKLFHRCFIVPVADVGEYAIWTERLKSYCPRFDIVFTNNPLVKQLFEADGFPVRKMFSSFSGLDASTIRIKLLENGAWAKDVPREVAAYLKELNAAGRLKAIVENEEKF